MKEGFNLGAKIRTKSVPSHYGELVIGPRPKHDGWKYPHYDGDGWYFVRWEGREEIFLAQEDDLVLVGPRRRPLHKTTITVWSEEFPGGLEDRVMDAAESTPGSSLVYFNTEVIGCPAADPDWDEHLEETFNESEDEKEEVPVEEESVFCEACGGDAIFQGALGNRKHYRCRACGLDSSYYAST